jgi:hypothetical protein
MRLFQQKTLHAGTFATLLAASVMLSHAPFVRADNGDGDESKIKTGFAIAPVPLNLRGKNRALVGLGSYIVNAQSACNDCHTQPNYAPGGDPFLGQTEQINTAGYLGGGRLFFGPIISRNLTPDRTGLPLGGAPLSEFIEIMRTGVDPDHAHPAFGPYLQVMPWPVYRNMTDRDLRAIYEYLSAIPCVEGDPGIPGAPPTGRCS